MDGKFDLLRGKSFRFAASDRLQVPKTTMTAGAQCAAAVTSCVACVETRRRESAGAVSATSGFVGQRLQPRGEGKSGTRCRVDPRPPLLGRDAQFDTPVCRIFLGRCAASLLLDHTRILARTKILDYPPDVPKNWCTDNKYSACLTISL